MSQATPSTTSSAGVPRLRADAALRIIDADDAACLALAVERHALPGQPVDTVIKGIDPAQLQREVFEARSRGHSLSVLASTRTGAPLHVHMVPAAETVSLYLLPLRQEEAAQRAAERHDALDRRVRLYATVLDNTPDFAYVWSLDYKFLYANPSLLNLYGLSAEQCVGHGFREVGYPDWHAAMHEREIDEVARSRQPLRGKIPFYGKGGGGIYDYIFVPVIGPDGNVEAVGGLTRDVTDLERTTQALKIADRRKDEFLATLAHELRNPLAAMRSALHLVRTSPADPEAPGAMAVMDRQLDHIVHLVDDLLDLSRVSRGAIQLRRGRHDLRTILQHAVDIARPVPESSGPRLTLTLPDTPLPIHADDTRVAQIFSNLLSNAIKYTPPGGAVTVTARARGETVRVDVRDTGAGIRPEDLDRVFEMFAQVERSDRQQGGLGIGLHLVRKLVELHDGVVTAASDGPGRGSVFSVELPLHRAATAPRAAAPEVAPARRRVLLVDDNVDAAFMLSLVLKQQGHEVHATYGAREALDLARTFLPDAIVLDIGMPELDGYEACRLLRRMDEVKHAYIVALTGWGMEEDRRRARAAGFDAHLVKPCDPAALSRLLSEMPTRLPEHTG